jgi:hypothetical protein
MSTVDLKGDWDEDGDYQGVSAWISQAERTTTVTPEQVAAREAAKIEAANFYGDNDPMLGAAYADLKL